MLRLLSIAGLCIGLANPIDSAPVSSRFDPSEKLPKEQAPYGVVSTIFSSDGQTLAVIRGELRRERYNPYDNRDHLAGRVNYYGQVDVWDLQSGTCKQSLVDFKGPVIAACFSSGAKKLATASWELRDVRPFTGELATAGAIIVIKLWNLETGRLEWSKESFTYDVTSLLFSPDETTLIGGGTQRGNVPGEIRYITGEVILWNLSTGQVKRRIEYRAPVTSITYSPDGRLVAVRKIVYTENRGEVMICDAHTWKEIRTLREARRMDPEFGYRPTLILAMRDIDLRITVFSADSRKLAVLTAGLARKELFSEVAVWDVNGGRLTHAIRVSTLRVGFRNMDLHSGLASAWMMRNGEFVGAVAFLTDGNDIATINKSVGLKIWNAETGELKQKRQLQGPATSVAFSPDSRIVATGEYDNSVRLHNIQTGRIERVLPPLEASRGTASLEGYVISMSAVVSLSWSSDGRTLATVSGETPIRLWDVRRGLEDRQLGDSESSFTCAAFSPIGKMLAAGGRDGTIRIWHADATEAIVFAAFDGPVSSIAFSPDGRLIAAAGKDGTAKVWDAESRRLETTLPKQPGALNSVTFSTDGKLLATGGADNSVHVWEVETGKLVSSHGGHLGPVRSVAFSPIGSLLASGSKDNTIHLWDYRTGRLRILAGHSEYVNAVVFGTGGRVLASASDDKTVRLWDSESGRVIRTLRGHDVGVYSLGFSPAGDTLASGGGNGAVAFWNPNTGELKRILKERVAIPPR